MLDCFGLGGNAPGMMGDGGGNVLISLALVDSLWCQFWSCGSPLWLTCVYVHDICTCLNVSYLSPHLPPPSLSLSRVR